MPYEDQIHTLTCSPEEQEAIKAQIQSQGIPMYSAAIGDSNAVCGCCPTIDERRRILALEKSLQANHSQTNADQIIKDARAFEAYLKGDDNA